MHIAGSGHRFVEGFTQFHDLPVKISDIFKRIARGFDHKLVIALRLNFQVIIKFNNLCDLFLRPLVHDGAVQFAGFTCRSDDQSFPVLIDQGFGHSRAPVKVPDVGFRHQTV